LPTPPRLEPRLRPRAAATSEVRTSYRNAPARTWSHFPRSEFRSTLVEPFGAISLGAISDEGSWSPFSSAARPCSTNRIASPRSPPPSLSGNWRCVAKRSGAEEENRRLTYTHAEPAGDWALQKVGESSESSQTDANARPVSKPPGFCGPVLSELPRFNNAASDLV